MIRKSVRNRKSTRTNRSFRKGSRRQRQQASNSYEALEARRVLAATAVLNAGTLTITQTINDGDLIIDNAGAGDAFRVTDGSGTTEFDPATNVIINLFDGTGNQLDFSLVNAHTGNVEINAGLGDRTINFSGTMNSIGGDLTVEATSGDQVVNLATMNDLTVSGSALIDLASGNDTVEEAGNRLNFGDLTLICVNTFESNQTMNVAGDVSVDNTGDTHGGFFDNDAGMHIGGNFIYTGNNLNDTIALNANFKLTGNLIVDGGEGELGVFLNSQLVRVSGATNITSSSVLGGNTLLTDVNATYDGDISVQFGDGINLADFVGTFNGSNVAYTGGSSVDLVSYDFTGNPADVTVNLGDGSDEFALGPNAQIAPTTLTVNFGDDNDQFINNLGAFNFNANLNGLQGFDFAFDGATAGLTATEISNTGPVEFANDGVGNAIQLNNLMDLMPADHLNITMLHGMSPLDIQLENPLAGNIVANLSDGDRDLNFTGSNNMLGGDLTINGAAGIQYVRPSINSDLNVGGDIAITTGSEVDVFDGSGNEVVAGGDVSFSGVNTTMNGPSFVIGGGLNVRTTGEVETNTFGTPGYFITVADDFNYDGGDGTHIVAIGGISVGGNTNINLGDNTVGGTQSVILNNGMNVFTGNVDISSTAAMHPDEAFLDGQIDGNVSIDLGSGENTAWVAGNFNGTSIVYNGGSDADDFGVDTTGTPADVDAFLGDGDDNFSLGISAAISTLDVDFGAGVDTFTNDFGEFNFDANFTNWDGFNRFYRTALNQWNVVQLADNGDVTIDTNGAGGALGLTNTYQTWMSPADNYRLNLMNNTSGNVFVDFDNHLDGDLILDIKSGDRSVEFVGTDNGIGGNLRIDAGTGDQHIDLAINNDLHVGESAIINTREGFDTVTDGGSNVEINEFLMLRSVDSFENTGNVDVGDLVANTRFHNERGRFDNDGYLDVERNFTFLGGTNKDDVFLSDGVYVGGNTFIDLGENQSTEFGQTVNLSGFEGIGNVSIQAGESYGGNRLITNHMTDIDGFFVADFSANTQNNDVMLAGNLGGNFGFIKGGMGQDSVSIDFAGGDMDLYMELGDGDDTVNLDVNTIVNLLFVNFGDGADSFNDGFGGNYPFTTFFGSL